MTSPSYRGALFSSLAGMHFCGGRFKRPPFLQVMAMLFELMFSLRAKQSQILWAVVRFVMVDVVDAFLRIQESPKQFFHDEAMLIHVPVSVGVRMIRRRTVHVAATVDPSAAFPFVVGGALFYLMAWNKAEWLAFLIATVWAICCGTGCVLTTSAGAESVRDGLLQGSSFDEHVAGIWASGPVSLAKPLRRLNRKPASTLTQGGVERMCHMPIITNRPRLA
jgi:hypothetical protein